MNLLAADFGDLIIVLVVGAFSVLSWAAEKAKKKKQAEEQARRGHDMSEDSETENNSVEDLVTAMRKARDNETHSDRTNRDIPSSSGKMSKSDNPATARSRRARQRLQEINRDTQSDDYEDIITHRQQTQQRPAPARKPRDAAAADQLARASRQQQARQKQAQEAARAQRIQQARQQERQRKAQIARDRQAELARRQKEEQASLHNRLDREQAKTSSSATTKKKQRKSSARQENSELTVQQISPIEGLNIDLSDRKQMRLGIVLSEILSPPIALRDQH